MTLKDNWREILPGKVPDEKIGRDCTKTNSFDLYKRKPQEITSAENREETGRTLDNNPPDDYEILETSGEGLLCGVRAIIGSLESQTTLGTTPSVNVMNLLNDKDIGSFETETRQLARYNDQLGAILHLWGLRQNPSIHLQLGYIVQNGRTFLVPTPFHANTMVI